MKPVPLPTLIRAAANCVIAHSDELTALDQAIGDGDHGLNMKRGFEAVLTELDQIENAEDSAVLAAVGKALVMKVGGASGPLYGTLFLQLGKSWPATTDVASLHACFESAVQAVAARGKSQAGQKTMLDVLFPVVNLTTTGTSLQRTARRGEARSAGDHSDGSDPRTGLVSQGTIDRPHGPRRALEPVDDRSRVRSAGEKRMRRARCEASNELKRTKA